MLVFGHKQKQEAKGGAIIMSYKETLLQPIKIGNRVAQNRFFIQAMECNKEDETGNPSEAVSYTHLTLPTIA